MLINTDPKTKKSILAAMTLAEYESLTTAEKTVIELSQYAEAEAYSILETAKLDGHAAGMEQGLLEGMEKGLQEGREEGREEGRQEGRQEGIEKGRQEGAHQQALETARNFLRLGLSIEQASIGTGLGIEEVEYIKASLNIDTNKDSKS